MTILRQPNGFVSVESVREMFSQPAVEMPVSVYDPATGFKTLEDFKAVGMSASDVYAVHGKDYRIHQYSEWLVDNVEPLVGDLHIASAGRIKGGRVGFVALELGETFKGVEGVEFKPRLTAATSLDGSIATSYKQMNMLPICLNTLMMGLAEAGPGHKVKHTRFSKFDADVALEAVGLVEAVGAKFAAAVETYVSTKVDEPTFDRFITAYIPRPEGKGRGQTMADSKRERIRELWSADDRVTPWRGTQFGVLQAVNTYATWDSTVRNMERDERNALNDLTGRTESVETEAMKVLASVM